MLTLLLQVGIAVADDLPTPALDATSDDAPPPPLPDSTVELWAGRMAVFGERRLPLLGTVEFRNDNYVLAEVTRTATGGYALEQKVCRVGFEKVAGAQASMDPKGIRTVPSARPRFEPSAHGFTATPWSSGWDASDWDADGFPGIAVRVQAPLCGGTMHFASVASTVANAVAHQGGLKGRARVEVAQVVQKVQGRCLSMVTRDMTQQLDAQFVYVPVPAGTTCDTVPEAAWLDPVRLDLGAVAQPVLPDIPHAAETRAP